MPCPANSRETKIGVGFVEQDDLATPNTAAEIFSFTLTNTAPFTVNPQTEDNAADIGKGDEFPTQVFPLGIDITGRIEKMISSQVAAWAFVFGLNNTTKAAAGTGTKYTCVPADPATECIDMPPFTAVEQIRPGGTPPFLDRAMIGMVISGFAINLESGPGRNNARLSIDVVGTGKQQSPSGIVLPNPITESFLNASSATITIGGIDYILAKSFISAEVTWNVNPRLDSGYYPGSGVDANGFAMRGRMEYANRVCGMSFVARAQPGNPEYNQLVTLNRAPATITLTGAGIANAADTNKHGIRIHFPHAMYQSVVNGDADGLVTINCTLRAIKQGTDPYCVFEATTDKSDIALLPPVVLEMAA